MPNPNDLTRDDLYHALEAARHRLTATMTRPQLELLDAFESATSAYRTAELDWFMEQTAGHSLPDQARRVRALYEHLLDEPLDSHGVCYSGVPSMN